jgi:hypothetical protein
MRPAILVLIFSLLSFCGSAFAEAPTAVINGPTGGQAGNILILDASESNGDYFSWLAFPSTAGGGETIQPIEGGRRAIVCSVPGSYVVVLAVANKDGLSVRQFAIRVTPYVGPDNPSPQPDPEPQPQPPQPRFPDSKLGISDAVYDAAVKIPNVTAESGAIARNLRSVCAQIGAGTLKGRAAILNEMKRLNSQTLSKQDRFNAWLPVLKDVMNSKLSELDKAGKLSTDQDLRSAFIEIATALEALQ